jgi:hypothetical protein
MDEEEVRPHSRARPDLLVWRRPGRQAKTEPTGMTRKTVYGHGIDLPSGENDRTKASEERGPIDVLARSAHDERHLEGPDLRTAQQPAGEVIAGPLIF